MWMVFGRQRLHVMATPGSGKTTLRLELIAFLGAPTLVLSTTVTMYPLDLEEFCWAHGVQDSLLAEAERAFNACVSVDEFVHERLSELFWEYLAVGGMPDPVAAFAESGNLSQVRLLQGAIVEQYRYDISKYAGRRSRVVRRIFDLMPSEISRQDKRFVVQTGDRVIPIEVKSGNQYRRHSALTKALDAPNWGIERAVVLHEDNVETDKRVSYLPTYMIMFLEPGFWSQR